MKRVKAEEQHENGGLVTAASCSYVVATSGRLNKTV